MLKISKRVFIGLLSLTILLTAVSVTYIKWTGSRTADIVTDAAQPQQSLTEYFQEKRVYAWSESVGDAVLDHRGGLLFSCVGDKIYSVAWWGGGSFAPTWPKVEGVGYVSGNRVSIVYRNASGDPESDFYHALVHFDFSKDKRSFTCTFVQQETAGSVQRSEGAAIGQLSTLMDLLQSEFEAEKYERSFSRWVRRSAADEPTIQHCPVIPSQLGRDDLSLRHEDREYTFCCPSCVELFKADPGKFIHKR